MMPREIVYNTDEVLDKVIHLFWKKGYNGTSMQDLTEVTGLNRSSIYNSFGSKMQLYKLALKTYQKQAQGQFQKSLMRTFNSREAVEKIFKKLIDRIVEDKENKGCLSLNCKAEMSEADEGLKKWLEVTQDQTLDFFEQLVVDGQKSGLFNTTQSASAYAHYLFNAYQGLVMTGILVKDRKILQAIVDSTLKTIR